MNTIEKVGLVLIINYLTSNRDFSLLMFILLFLGVILFFLGDWKNV